MIHNSKKVLSRRGFTLIEMLIVVAIIGILASVVLVGLGPIQRQGRDARRISDLKQIQTALELVFNKEGAYPDAPATQDRAGWQAWADAALVGGGIGVSNIPQDPNPLQSYRYRVNDTNSSYVLAATLEETSNPALDNDVDGTVLSEDCGSVAQGQDEETPSVYCVQL